MDTENLPQFLHEYVESIDLRLKGLKRPAAPEATTEECLISDITYKVPMLAVRTSKEEMSQDIDHKFDNSATQQDSQYLKDRTAGSKGSSQGLVYSMRFRLPSFCPQGDDRSLGRRVRN